MLPQFGIFWNTGYKVNGDTVTLLGQVRNATLKDFGCERNQKD